MTFSLRTLFIICGAMLFFTACQKDDIDTITPNENPTHDPDKTYTNSLINAVTSGNNEYIKLACVEIDLPFSLKLENDQSLVVQSFQEFTQALNTTSGNKVLDFEFPLEGTDHNGNRTTFTDSKSLGTSYASCVPGEGWAESRIDGSIMPAFLLNDYCLDLVYPVNLIDGNGNVLIAEDILDIIKFRMNNDEIFYSLPLKVQDDRADITIGSLDDMFDVFADCEEGNYTPLLQPNDSTHISPYDCLEFVYPIDVLIIVPDTVATINSEDELIQLCLSGIEYELLFPVDIIDEGGNQRTLTEIDDLLDVFVDCGIIQIDTSSNVACQHVEAHVLLFYNGLDIFTRNNYEYDINFPVTLIVEGNSITLNNEDDYIPAIGGDPSRFKSAEIVYPVTVTQFGRNIVLNNDDDVCEFYRSLLEPCVNKPAHIQLFHNTVGVPIDCAFFVEYPLEITNNGTTVTIQNRDQYLSELDVPGAYDNIELVYPVTVSKVQSGQLVTFNSDDDICDFINVCR